MRFQDRRDAGRQVAGRLIGLCSKRPVILGLPHGGVPVAAQVAQVLGAPLDVIVVRRLRTPGNAELTRGAVGEHGVRVLNSDAIRSSGVSMTDLAAETLEQTKTVQRHAALYRRDRAPLPIAGRTVVIVDDGAVTGSTARAACKVARARGADRIVLAVTVATPEVVERLHAVADKVVCLYIAPWLHSVGQFYEDFGEVSDQDVIGLLAGTGTRRRGLEMASPSGARADRWR